MPIKYQQSLFVMVMLLASAGAAQTNSVQDYFSQASQTPRIGKVGHPFSADTAFEVEDMPARCIPEWRDIAIAGSLPPGLLVANSSTSIIAGTPVTAGDWQVTMTFHDLGCASDATKRADHSIEVKFHITA